MVPSVTDGNLDKSVTVWLQVIAINDKASNDTKPTDGTLTILIIRIAFDVAAYAT